MSQEMPHMDYTREIECDYKKHHYSVRDNGSIMRHQEGFFPLEGAEWTFGSPNANGKLAYKGVLIERIVATAFLGEVDNDFFVVDHIDGDIDNNSADNLRWFSPIEAILDNPETVRVILETFGDVDTFMIDPTALAKAGDKYSRFHFIKKEEVEEAVAHLVSMSTSGPLKSGNLYIDWLNNRPAPESDDLSEGDCDAISLSDVNAIWPKILELYNGTPRFKQALDSLRKEMHGSTLSLFFKTEMQADWFKRNKLQEFQVNFRKLIGSQNVRIEACIDN